MKRQNSKPATKLMSRMFSDETPAEEKQEVGDLVNAAASSGSASNDDYNAAKLGDVVVVEEKSSGEITKATPNPENPQDIQLEAVKVASEMPDGADQAKAADSPVVNGEGSQSGIQEAVTQKPGQVADLSTTEKVEGTGEELKVMSANLKSLNDNFNKLFSIIEKSKVFAEAAPDTTIVENTENVQVQSKDNQEQGKIVESVIQSDTAVENTENKQVETTADIVIKPSNEAAGTDKNSGAQGPASQGDDKSFSDNAFKNTDGAKIISYSAHRESVMSTRVATRGL